MSAAPSRSRSAQLAGTAEITLILALGNIMGAAAHDTLMEE